jgi:hypothetical protein
MDRQTWNLVGSAGVGAGLGAGLMYLLDPQGGRRRRAVARDKTVSALNKGGDAVRKTSRDLGNRTKGLVAKAGSRLRRNGDAEVDDQVLRDRVRSKLGRALSHASALDVTAENGRIILAGPVLAHEADRLLDAVRSVKGVKDVECRFDLHEHAEDNPAFQGNGQSQSTSRFANRKWVPVATRVLTGSCGSALAVAGLKKKGPLGLALGTVALGLLAHGTTNASPRKLAKMVRERRGGQDLAADVS